MLGGKGRTSRLRSAIRWRHVSLNTARGGGQGRGRGFTSHGRGRGPGRGLARYVPGHMGDSVAGHSVDSLTRKGRAHARAPACTTRRRGDARATSKQCRLGLRELMLGQGAIPSESSQSLQLSGKR